MIKSLTAGICIGLGGTCYLSVEDKTVGAFLFSIGLLSILIFKLDLYTGWVCRLDKYEKPLSMAGVFVGNFAGAFIIGVMCRFKQAAITQAWAVCSVKLDKELAEWLVMSLFCGAFIAIAVYGWEKMNSYLIVVLAVMGFILSGSEHVIADIYYFTAAGIVFEQDVLTKLFQCAVGNLFGGLAVGGLITLCEKKEIDK